jgi:hypothetical protein
VHRLELYFKTGTHYEKDLEDLRRRMHEIENSWKVDFQEFDVDQLSPEERIELVDDIRGISPQARGRIVTSRGKTLPLSGSKLLNVENTPIVVLRENERAANVFPHLLGTAYFDVVSSLERILSLGPTDHLQSRGLLEDPMVKIVADNPELLGKGMSFVESNVMLPGGSVDLVLRDREGTDVVVEAETRASDQAVGQVLRLARGYAQQTGKKLVRKSIICIDFDSGLPLACKEAEIDLLRLAFLKVDDE